jgi:hypothetical protein
MTVESDANLVQINNDAQNIGNITVKRKATLKRLDYNLLGSTSKRTKCKKLFAKYIRH